MSAKAIREIEHLERVLLLARRMSKKYGFTWRKHLMCLDFVFRRVRP